MVGATFEPIWDIFLANVTMETIAYCTGKRTEGVAEFRCRGTYWDSLVVGISVPKVTVVTIACCGIVLLLCDSMVNMATTLFVVVNSVK
jgi:hypothetical protein